MLRIGITGGIGSGKSVVARVFENLGIPVYNADNTAKMLMETDVSLVEKITRLFGPAAYTDQRLNRSYIAAQVFNNQEKLDALNAIVHPAVIQYGEDWFARQHAPYAIKEAALFFETGTAGQMDKMIGVSAPVALRIQRAMQRDQLSREQIKNRMDKQLDESIKMRLCDYVVVNDDQHLVLPQVLRLDSLFRLQGDR
ncbi:MAG: dephospho-CoA kinase [Bacteroidetes bacterium]|nr:dephospho-CoA kinase [Bacteroidota bacterium]